MLLSDLIARGPLLADGAMATNLFTRDLGLDEPPELWNALHPARVRVVHAEFIAAGAAIILTNSFGGHPWRLRRHGLADRAAELNGRAASNARAAVAAAGRPVFIAGSVGPTGESDMAEVGAAGFAIQTRALMDAGVDALWIETMAFAAEIRAAAHAAAMTGLPYVLTATFGGDGRTRGGLSAREFADLATALPVRPAAIGVNCCATPADLLQALEAMRAGVPHLPLIAKPSAGLPRVHEGQLDYPLSPADLAQTTQQALAASACVVGGCCGTTPAHLAAMAVSVECGGKASPTLAREPRES